MFIYALTDPRTNEIRYIGKTVRSLRGRLSVHLTPKALVAINHRTNWIKSLLNDGLKPQMLLLCDNIANPEELDQEERWWIAHGHQIGLNLTNSTWGGDGKPTGHFPSAESNLKRSIAMKNLPKEVRDRVIASSRAVTVGRKHTAEENKKSSLAQKGKVFSKETRLKMSLAKKGRRSPFLGKTLSLEHRIKLALAKSGNKKFVDQNGTIYCSTTEAAIILGLSTKNIGRVLNGSRKSAHGYTFKYIEVA